MPSLFKQTYTLEIVTAHEKIFPIQFPAEMQKQLISALENGEALLRYIPVVEGTQVITNDAEIRREIGKHGEEYDFFFDEEDDGADYSANDTNDDKLPIEVPHKYDSTPSFAVDFIRKPVSEIEFHHFVNLVNDFKDEIAAIYPILFPGQVLPSNHPFGWNVKSWPSDIIRKVILKVMERHPKMFAAYGYGIHPNTHSLYWPV